MEFSTQNNDCHNIENLNSNTDDIQDLISIAKQKNLTMLRMQISENAAVVHKFIGFLINNNNNISCTLTNSLKHVQYLLAQNTFRIYPTTGRQMINYRDGMLSRFRYSMKRSCIRQGRFPLTFITKNFTVGEPRIEYCATSCYFKNSNY